MAVGQCTWPTSDCHGGSYLTLLPFLCCFLFSPQWYFLADNRPKHPVFDAFRRAATTSFGSICFGTFLVALIRTLRFFVNQAYQQARQSNNDIAAFLLCCLECVIGCIEGIVNYINQVSQRSL